MFDETFDVLEAIQLSAGQGPCEVSVIDLTLSVEEPSEMFPASGSRSRQMKSEKF